MAANGNNKAQLDLWYFWDHRPEARRLFEELRRCAVKMLDEKAVTLDGVLVAEVRRAIECELVLDGPAPPRKPTGIVDPWQVISSQIHASPAIAPSVPLFGLDLTHRLGLALADENRLMALQFAMALIALELPPETEAVKRTEALKPPIRALKAALERIRKMEPWPPAGMLPAIAIAVESTKHALAQLEAVSARLASYTHISRDHRLMVLFAAAGVAKVREKDIAAYLSEAGYPEAEAKPENIRRQMSRLRAGGYEQPVAKTALNKERPRTSRKKT
jgi:hypothetical protein